MTVDITAIVLALISQLGPIILTAVVGFAAHRSYPWVVARIGEKNAASLQLRVNEVLNAAIGFGVQKGTTAVLNHGAITVETKNLMVEWAVNYASAHAPELMTQVGNVFEKVLARFDTHPAVQGLAYSLQPPAAAPAIAHAA